MIQRLPRIQLASQPAGHPAGHAAGQTTFYIVYMDNYFSTVSLFKVLRDIRYGAYGTTRKQGGIPSQLIKLKDYIKSIL
jgi:hypothetical protein